MHFPKTRGFLSGVLAAGLIGLIAGSGFTDDAAPSDDEMMKMMMELSKPGPGHKAIDPMVGEFDVVSKMWMKPGDEPMESKATCTTTWTLGGRYAEVKYSGKFKMGEVETDFEGRGVLAFDNYKKQYQNTWRDSFSTNIMIMTGEASEEGNRIELNGVWDGPMGKMGMRHVYAIESNDKYVLTAYMSTPQGEVKHMELTFTRKKAAASSGRCCPPQTSKGPGY